MNTTDCIMKCPSRAGEEPLARSVCQGSQGFRKRKQPDACRLEMQLLAVNHRIERLQEKRAAFRGRVAGDLNAYDAGQGRWFSVNTALLLLAGAFNGQLYLMGPWFTGLVLGLVVVFWVFYIHDQMRRESKARAIDRLLRAQIMTQFELMEKIRCQLAAQRSGSLSGSR